MAQGANDPRVKKAESEQIVIALRDRGFPVEYIMAPDEGHGFARPVNNMALFAAAEGFFAKHLGGRHQPDMPAEVGAPEGDHGRPQDRRAGQEGGPGRRGRAEARRRPGPGTASYQATMVAGGQTQQMSVTRSIKDEGGTWVVTETAKLPMGEAVDTTMLEKGRLVVPKRTIKQGPVDVS